MGFIDGEKCFTRKVDNFVQDDGVKNNLGRENYAMLPIARRPANLTRSGLHFMPLFGSSVFLVQVYLAPFVPDSTKVLHRWRGQHACQGCWLP